MSLSSRSAIQRGINQGNSTQNSVESLYSFGNNFDYFTVKDWAGLLKQSDNPQFYSGKSASITGFILKSETPDVYYVSRFVISCCSIDAQPLGVPIYVTGPFMNENEWVTVKGVFEKSPISTGPRSVIIPTAIDKIEQPKTPYEYR